MKDPCNGKHRYTIFNTEDNRPECAGCGLRKSTIEATENKLDPADLEPKEEPRNCPFHDAVKPGSYYCTCPEKPKEEPKADFGGEGVMRILGMEKPKERHWTQGCRLCGGALDCELNDACRKCALRIVKESSRLIATTKEEHQCLCGNPVSPEKQKEIDDAFVLGLAQQVAKLEERVSVLEASDGDTLTHEEI